MRKTHWARYLLLCFLILIAAMWATDYWVANSTQKQLYSDLANIPKNKVGLVLGTSKYVTRGVINPYYQYRIDAAVELFMSGKIDFILVSGAKNGLYYNEPAMMKKDLIARGIPANKIYTDYAGVRTLDSILRCRDIFGQDHFTVVSQAFHNERAIFIANHKNIVAVAYNAKGVGGFTAFKVDIREKLSRMKMLFDLLFNTREQYYGQKVEIK